MPSHPVALELLQTVNLPIAAPSANVSGRPSPTRASHVAEDLGERIAGIVDGGDAEIGLESTVIDCTVDPPMILRPGAVTREAMEAVIGPIGVVDSGRDAEDTPKAPGMKYTHYAPRAPMTIVKGSEAFFRSIIQEAREKGQIVGVLVTEEHAAIYEADVILTCGTSEDISSVAKGLYDALRGFDRFDVDVIYSESFAETGVGEAVMNRLLKASGYRVIEESQQR